MNVKKKKLKIAFSSSSGGHFEQLMMLFPLMEKYESFILTEKVTYSLNTKEVKLYYLSQINRKEIKVFLKFLWNFLISIKVFLNEKPDVIISTGAMSTIPICIIGKIFRKKVIYVESFAKINSPTLTGKLMYKFADQFYVQWEEMNNVFPNAIYKGSIY